jgi:hypothetical protein
MSNQNSEGLGPYQAVIAGIEESTFDYIMEQITKRVPESHVTLGTIHYVMLQIATYMICVVCGDKPTAKEQAIADFCTRLPRLVRDAKHFVIPANVDMNKTQ